MMKEILRVHFPHIDSTNAWCKANAHLLKQDKITLVTAEAQSKGRGRLNRQWISPAGQNIYASYCFFVPHSQPGLFNIAQILSVSALKALENVDYFPKLKWPNDILLSNKKLGGILCETVSLETNLCVIAGIGLNVNMPLEEAEKINQPATSLLIESGTSLDIQKILEKLSEIFVKDLDLFFKNGFASFVNNYASKLIHMPGDKLKLNDNRMVFEGLFHSINCDGSLNLLLPNGKIKKFYCAEIG